LSFVFIVGLLYGFVPILGILMLEGGFKLDLAGLELGGKATISFFGGTLVTSFVLLRPRMKISPLSPFHFQHFDA
jgi:hypothetical protein